MNTTNAIRCAGEKAIENFTQRAQSIPQEMCAAFHDEASNLEAHLLALYRVTVGLVREEEDFDQIHHRWASMVYLCDSSLVQLKELMAAHPVCGADIYYDKILDMRNKCKRLENMHKA